MAKRSGKKWQQEKRQSGKKRQKRVCHFITC
uniref:Uncharacterized protein n=1 Tax=Siphoviridae sp. ct3yx7 TaxID=2825326 RepID=A0A8S5P409_9CAUD|nr:MAG TPA: hypothetical protein [Siphoviridae sp. ct3yx7]DAY76606.1 MAG TPA: hypothetical protein [Caudoviricetes sp.]